MTEKIAILIIGGDAGTIALAEKIAASFGAVVKMASEKAVMTDREPPQLDMIETITETATLRPSPHRAWRQNAERFQARAMTRLRGQTGCHAPAWRHG